MFTVQENTFLHHAKINQSILKHDRRCFTCIGKGHNSEQCEKSCRKCGSQKHHQSICPELHNNPSPRKPQEKSTPTASGDQCEKDGTTTATTNAESANPKRSVLLQTASAVATNEERTKSTTVRILFDNGSQRSYITENLRSKLQLKSLKNKKLNPNTFDESKFKTQNCDVVNLQLQKTEYNNPLTISALTFPVICWPLALPLNVSTSYAHLDGLELIDDLCTSARSIDLLIGSDYHWNFVTGEMKRGVEGPITINSKFDWLLSGSINGALDQGYVTYSNLIIEGQYPLFQPSADDVLANSLKDFWETESIGISDLSAKENVKNKSFEIDVK